MLHHHLATVRPPHEMIRLRVNREAALPIAGPICGDEMREGVDPYAVVASFDELVQHAFDVGVLALRSAAA